MKKTALMFALMTLAGAAMAEGCHDSYNNCQQPAAMAAGWSQASAGSTQHQTNANDAWARVDQPSVAARSGH
jgi:hypothetical protein